MEEKMKKKALVLLIGLLATAAVFAGCGSSETAQTESAVSSSAETTQTAGSGTLDGKYDVSIGDGMFVTDSLGNELYAISYTFTNNSDEATQPFLAVQGKAFQDGVQIQDTMYLAGDHQEVANNRYLEVKPGASIEVMQFFEVSDKTAPISFEMTPVLSLSNDKLEKEFTIA